MYSTKIEEIKKKTKLNKEQREIIIGKILGDGCLAGVNKKRIIRLQIEHSLSQKEYVDWVYKKLQNLIATPPKVKIQRINGKEYKKYWFNTLSFGFLRFYYQQFYKDGEKIVPKLIYKWLTPLALAVWFMDDGSIKSKECQGKYFNTQGFNDLSIKILQKALKRNFQIQTTLRKQKEGKQIYIPSREINKFKKIIGEYIIPSMKYKLG